MTAGALRVAAAAFAARDAVAKFTPGDQEAAAPGDVEKGAAQGEEPKKKKDEYDGSQGPPELLWWGPHKVGPMVLALHGPMQLIFIFLSVLAVIFGICQSISNSPDMRVIELITCWGFAASSIYIVYLIKGVYLLKWFRLEIAKFRELNEKLEVQVGNLTTQVGELTKQNEVFAQQNAELTKQNGVYAQQNAELTKQNGVYREENAEHKRLNQNLEAKVKDLHKVEKRLALLAADCGDSVEKARTLLERLERNIKLDTVNTVFQFFDRTDRNKTGKLEAGEVDLFVDNLSMLWEHLPGFDKDSMKTELMEQGGITLEQVHALVEAMMLKEDNHRMETLEDKLRERFRSQSKSQDFFGTPPASRAASRSPSKAGQEPPDSPWASLPLSPLTPAQPP